MRLYILTLPHFFEGESTAINWMLSKGDFTLHIRKPDASSQEIEHLILQINAYYYSRIVLHDAFELATQYQLKGIHLNRRQTQIPPKFKGSISRSCHSWEELLSYKSTCDYLFISPLFDSISKQNYSRAFEFKEIQHAQQEGWIDEKVVGLGGITPQRIPLLQAIGMEGVAMLGAIWDDYEDTQSVEALLGRLKDCLDLIQKYNESTTS